MKNLNIAVVDKVATYCKRDGSIVCGNSDYQITFTFDSEWDGYETKIARFILNGRYRDIPFEGDTVIVPIISNASQIEVGVYADNLSTTTPATIPCTRSILCGNATETDDPWGGLIDSTIGDIFFYTDGSLGLKYSIHANNAYCNGYESLEYNDIAIASKVKGVPVEAIDISAFSGNTDIVSVIIPDSVVSISNFAFKNCTNLKRIYIGKGVRTICLEVFAGCTSLTDVYYAGTEAEWEAINIWAGNDELSAATIHFNSEV